MFPASQQTSTRYMKYCNVKPTPFRNILFTQMKLIVTSGIHTNVFYDHDGLLLTVNSRRDDPKYSYFGGISHKSF